jgi:tetratricopeptide (TPR) repeat protein
VTRASMACAVAGLIALATPRSSAAGSDFWGRPGASNQDAADAQVAALVDEAAVFARSAYVFRESAEQAARSRRAAEAGQLRHEMARAGERALAAYENALVLRPNDPDLHYAAGGLICEYVYDYYGQDLHLRHKRDELGNRAITHWQTFERLSPKDPRRVNFVLSLGVSQQQPFGGAPQLVRWPFQFCRSIIYTKMGGDENYTRALDDYDYLLAVNPRDLTDAPFIALLLTNSAEILMALGRLDEAIERYREALDYEGEPLHYYGLAVALDRAGLGESALAAMRAGVEKEPSDQAALASLSRPSVFFIPPGDIDYYLGLGHLALGHAEKAAHHFGQFVRNVGDRSPYARRAAEHLDGLTGRTLRRRPAKAP